MKLSLTIWQRLVSLTIIGDISGTVATVRTAGKVLDALEMSKDDQQLAGLVEGRIETAKILKDLETRFAIEIGDREAAELYRRTMLGHQQWPAVAAKQVDDLATQLEKD